jgi:hypothetical protein
MACGSNDALYITLKNGERLPSFSMRIGQGIICNGCKKGGKVMRTYELEKVESYSIRARNIDEAMEILNGLDNSAAFRVNIRVVFAGSEEESK